MILLNCALRQILKTLCPKIRKVVFKKIKIIYHHEVIYDFADDPQFSIMDTFDPYFINKGRYVNCYS